MDFFVFFLVIVLVVLFWPLLKGFALLFLLAIVLYWLFFRAPRNPRL